MQVYADAQLWITSQFLKSGRIAIFDWYGPFKQAKTDAENKASPPSHVWVMPLQTAARHGAKQSVFITPCNLSTLMLRRARLLQQAAAQGKRAACTTADLRWSSGNWATSSESADIV